MSHSIRLFLIVIALPLSLAVVPATRAHAQASTAAVSPAVGSAGALVTGSGTNWTPGDQIQAVWGDDNSDLGSPVVVAADGTFNDPGLMIPANAAVGGHQILFWDIQADYFVPANFNVAPPATNCHGVGCAIAYSPAQQTAYFGDSPNSNNGDGQIDVGVRAQAAALTKCYNSGATDCDVAVWVIYGYVSIAIDSSAGSPVPWGVGWGGTASAAEESALNSCVTEGGSAQTCQLSTEYSSPNPSLASSGYPAWGAFSNNKYAGAIVWAYHRLGEKIDINECLVFVQKAFGWTKGGSWASPPASTAQKGFEYLEGQGLINTALPTDPSDVGDLVWFGPAPDGEGHVGIYIGGDNQFISATSGGVAIYDIPYWNANVATYEGFSSAPAIWLG
jgi:hypothetical protein